MVSGVVAVCANIESAFLRLYSIRQFKEALPTYSQLVQFLVVSGQLRRLTQRLLSETGNDICYAKRAPANTGRSPFASLPTTFTSILDMCI